MSAPDIGALGDAYVIAYKAAEEARRAYHGAARMAVLSAFGEANWGGGGFEVIQGEHNERWLNVCHHADRRAWVALAGVTLGEHKPCVEARADTPTAAVRQALDALAETHPTEAAALRAVIPSKEPTP